LERGFQEIIGDKPNKNNHLIVFYIEDDVYKKLMQIAKKYKLKFQNTLLLTIDTGFGVLKTLNFVRFIH